MTRFVKVITGRYRGGLVEDVVFPLIQDYEKGAKGGFIKVDARGIVGYPEGDIKVLIKDPSAYAFVGGKEAAQHLDPLGPNNPGETDDQAKARIRERFEIMDEITKAVAKGIILAVVVRGAPGVGKSYNVVRTLETAPDHVMGKLRFDPEVDTKDVGYDGKYKGKFDIIKGHVTPPALYKVLYDNSDRGQVLVFDDCDSIFGDETSLNLMKAALDTTDKRMLHWHSEGHQMAEVPTRFEYKGSVIFITNIDFDNCKASKIRDHLEAILSRCHYLDLTLDTMRDKFLRVEDVVQNSDMLADRGLNKTQAAEIMAFLKENALGMREMSLRMAIKLADLRLLSDKDWEKMARTTCMRRQF